MADITARPEWKKAAETLVLAGYQIERREGLIPAIFHKGDETVYLFRPILDNTYDYRQGERWWSDFDGARPVIISPVPPDQIDRKRAPWVPRNWESRPTLGYGIRDAAEHTGKSLATLKRDLYNEKSKNPLKPTAYIGGKRIVLFSEEALVEWLEKNPDGKKGRTTYLARLPNRRSDMKSQRIYRTLETMIREGNLKPDGFATALASVLRQPADDLIALAGSDAGLFVGLVKRHLTREQVVDLFVEP